MKFAIVGAGAIGGYLGTRLALAGESVTFIARNRKQILIGAAVSGFVIGGGIAAVGRFFRRG